MRTAQEIVKETQEALTLLPDEIPVTLQVQQVCTHEELMATVSVFGAAPQLLLFFTARLAEAFKHLERIGGDDPAVREFLTATYQSTDEAQPAGEGA